MQDIAGCRLVLPDTIAQDYAVAQLCSVFDKTSVSWIAETTRVTVIALFI